MLTFPSILRATVLSISLVAPALAQEATPVDPMPPISRTVLHTFEIDGAGMAAALVLVDIAPNVAVGRHSHPGPVSAYVIYGSIEVEIEGEAPRRFAAGESFTVPAATVHDERTGAAGAKVIASFVAPAGTPLSTPAK